MRLLHEHMLAVKSEGKIGIWLHKYFKVRHKLHYPDQGSLAVVRLEVRGLP